MHTSDSSSTTIDLVERPVVVTGAAGFIGHHVCRRLLDDGYSVVGIDVVNDYYARSLKEHRLLLLAGDPRFTFHRLDCADTAGIHAVFAAAQPRTVIHLAAQAGVRYSIDHPEAYLHSNLTGFGSVLEAARSVMVDHLVYASSSSVYGAMSPVPFDVHLPAAHPISLYAATKRANELMAHSYSYLFGLPTTGLRFFTVYGPLGRPDMAYYAFADAIMNGRRLTLYGDGSAVRDFTYVDDIVEGVVRIAGLPPTGSLEWHRDNPDPATSSAPFRLFNIGHGHQATVRELISTLEELIGRPALVDQHPPAMGDVPRTHARTDDLEQATGFIPRVGMREGLERFVTWLNSYQPVSA